MLLTKLHTPSAGNDLVHRSGLFNRLNEGLNRKLILISAPAGFGKTTIISDWVKQNEIPNAWFSLDKGDNDPAVFLGYIIIGIQNIWKEFGQSALELLKSPKEPNSIPLSNVPTNIVSMDSEGLKTIGFFNMSAISNLGEWLDPDNLPVLED